MCLGLDKKEEDRLCTDGLASARTQTHRGEPAQLHVVIQSQQDRETVRGESGIRA